MTGFNTIESEEDLKKYLGSEKEEPPAKEKGETKKQPDPSNIGDEGEEEVEPKLDEDGEGEEGKSNDKPVEYDTVLHYLNEKHNLGLNLEEVKELSKEQEAEALDSLIERFTTGVNTALEEYQYIEGLLQDPEVQEVLRAKHEGKSLRDLYSKFSSSPEGMDDESLALQDFKKRFPKSPDEVVKGMVDSLKQNGQFEPFVKSLREQIAEEQSLEQQKSAEEEARKAQEDAAREQEELTRYAQYLGGVNAVYGVPLTQEMKEAVYQMTTVRDEKGLTQLDHALQSDEGLVLATLGIAYMKQLIQNGASIQKNRARGRVMDKIFETPDKLQSGGNRGNQGEDPYDPSVLNRF